jgi:hypothetical protein
VQLPASLRTGFRCGFIQIGVASIITFTGTGGLTLGVAPGFIAAPITSDGDNAEVTIRKDAAAHGVVTGVIV